MILDLYGLKINEEVLSEKCQTTPLGTSADEVVQAVRELGFIARKEHATFDDLRQYLATNIFPILFINLLVIDSYNTTHAVIVEAISDTEIKILDPRIGSRNIDIELMRYAWQRTKNVAIIIEKPA
jgi:ABC-type bacteriocin/lantibiotic exporter with double-glycine peptidase domain